MPVSAERVHAAVAELCDLPGPTGQEDAVREHLRAAWEPYASELRTDAVGNLLARVGEGSGPRLLIEAHMDEIGFKVRAITDDGFLLLANAQTNQLEPQERRYMVGQPAQVVRRGEVVAQGIFAAPSGHVLTPKLMAEGHLLVSDFFLDIGCASRAEAQARGVHVGASVIFDVAARSLGTRVVGKAMDDRMLLAIMTLLLERLDPAALTVDLWLGATVQEENGLHGARALAATERFDAVIALDVGLTGDVPILAVGDVATTMGAGPIVVHSDQMIHYHGPLTWELLEVARAAGIPVQDGMFGGYGSDGCAFFDAGMRAALVATPVRYTHTAVEMVDVGDVAQTVELLNAYVTGPARAARG